MEDYRWTRPRAQPQRRGLPGSYGGRGAVGPATLAAFRAFMAKRSSLGEVMLLRAPNAQQGERYIAIAENRPKDEDFVFEWFANRVVI